MRWNDDWRTCSGCGTVDVELLDPKLVVLVASNTEDQVSDDQAHRESLHVQHFHLWLITIFRLNNLSFSIFLPLVHRSLTALKGRSRS